MEIVKKTITADMVGQQALFCMDDSDIKKISEKAKYHCDVKKITNKNARSLKQLKLWKQASKYVAFNSDDKYWKTQNQVETQVKIKIGYPDGVASWIMYYNKKEKTEQVQLIPKSVSYETMGHLEACNFFDQGYFYMSEHLKMGQDDFIKAVMGSVGEDMPLKDNFSEKVKETFNGSFK